MQSNSREENEKQKKSMIKKKMTENQYTFSNNNLHLNYPNSPVKRHRLAELNLQKNSCIATSNILYYQRHNMD